MGYPQPITDDTPDAVLVERCQQGSRTSFDLLVRRHYALAYNVAYRLLGSHDAAADATQAAFVRAYNAIARFRRDATFSTWLYRIITNVCFDRLREDGRSVHSLTFAANQEQASLEEMDVPDTSHDPALASEQHERQRLVQEALMRLAPDHRAVVVMYDLGGASYEEIAQALEIPLGTVKSRLNRARHALKAELAPYLELFR